MSRLSQRTGIHMNAGKIISSVTALASGNPLAALGVAFTSQRSPVIGPKNDYSAGISFNNPFSNPSGLIGDVKTWMTEHTGGGGGKRGRIAAGPNGACPKGWHLNKHKLADGTAPHSVCVRNRHMNPANGRAIGRAIRRIASGEHQYKRVYTILHKHAGGKVMPKRRHKR